MIAHRTALIALLALCCAGCRDGASPFVAPDNPPLAGSPIQLTFNPGDDLNPTWSTNSDTVYYTARNFIDQPGLSTSMLRIGRTGGVAQLIAPGVPPQALMLPATSHNRVAYVELGFINTPAQCEPVACRLNEPLLETGTVRVREAGAIAGVAFDAGTPIPFEGVDADRTQGQPSPFDQHYYPFQAAYRERGELLFRPTWAPDGQRVAFSDGLSLYIWGTSKPTPATKIPGTSDGVSPAWSPDGAVIAFTRVARADSTRLLCLCRETPQQVIPDIHNRWTHNAARGVITLVKPDGTGLVSVTDGEEPAWSSDGATIYFVRDDRIYRIPRAGGTAAAVPNTVGGHAPSLSPDGRWLAFTRGTVEAGITVRQDIWLIDLSVQQ